MKAFPERIKRFDAAGWAVCGYLLGFTLPLPLDAALLFLAALGGYAVLTVPARHSPSLLLVLAGLALVLALGNAVSPDPRRSLNLSLALLPAAAVCLLVAGYFRFPGMIRLCWTMTGFTIVVAGWLLLVAAAHPGRPPSEWIGLSRLTAFKVPNDVVILAVFLPFSLALWRLYRAGKGRWAVPLAVMLVLAVAVLYRSRLSLLVVATVVTVFHFGLGEARRLGRMLLLAVSGSFLVDALAGFQLAEKFRSLATAGTRLPLWIAAWRMFLDAPWTGHGVGSFRLLYRFHLQPLPEWIVVDPRLTPWAHNIFLELLAELGVGGLLAFALFFGFPLRLWRSVREERGREKPVDLALIAAFAGFCVAGMVELSLWRQWVGLTFLLLVGCIARQNNQNREEE